MRRSFFTRLVFLNTFKKKLRALLVIGGIAITSSAMIVLFGVSGGLHHLVSDQIASSEAKDVITVDQRNLQQIKLNDEKVSQVNSISGVGDVESSVGLVGDINYKGIDLNIPLYGLSKNYFTNSPAKFRAGDSSNLTGNNVIVSTKALEAYHLSPADAIGKQITTIVTISSDYASTQTDQSVSTKPDAYTIVGVVDRADLPVAYLPLETLRTHGVDSVSQLKVRVNDSQKALAVRESVEQMGFKTSSIQDTVDQINKLFTVIHRALILFAFIVFGITVSGTFTIISLTLMEEMRQIGFLRVSGLKNQDVRVLFIVQSIVLTSLGAFCGVIIGIFAGSIVNGLAAAATTSQTFTGKITIFAIPGPQIVAVMLLSVGIGWVVGLFPAKRAVNIGPLEEMTL